jgi:hypothetical protein
MTYISNWTTRSVQELYLHGPYALAAISPGGSLTAALGGAIITGLVSLCRHARVRPSSLAPLKH